MLILQLKDGNETVFKQVYDLTHTKVFRYFLKRNATHDTARDLTQQTFIRLWQYRQSLKEDRTLDTQLFTVANSVLIDHLRRHTHRQQVQHSFSDLQPASTQQALLAYEQQDYLHAAIAHLPPVRQKVIQLRLIHGFTNKEIALHLSIGVKTVEDHITKALRQVKSMQLLILLLIYIK